MLGDVRAATPGVCRSAPASRPGGAARETSSRNRGILPGAQPTTYTVSFTPSSKVTVPPKAEYALTAPGQGLRGTVDVMGDRPHRHLGRIEAARRAFDAPDA
nr:hypothetical protein [Streptomyces sp. MBT51]